jgi:hypothetical protein
MKAKLSGQTGNRSPQASTGEITFNVERDEQDGGLTASWDAPRGQGGITTHRDLREIEQNVSEAVRCHFENGNLPGRIRLHFVNDPVLAVGLRGDQAETYE